MSDRYTSPRFALYRLADCDRCQAEGKLTIYESGDETAETIRCPDCQGEGRTRQVVAEADTPEAVGVALVTLGREGEFEGVPFGLLDREGEKGRKWLVRPWLPSARNVSDAARTLRRARA
jgi:hypothetical protein